MYWIKRKYQQIKNVFHWIPVIWKTFDWDYRYSLDVFKFQLQKQVKFLESDRAMSVESKNTASRIKMVLRLMDKVYDEDYGCEYQDKLKEKYGEDILKWEFIDTGKGDGSSYLKYKYEMLEDEDLKKKIDDDHNLLFEESKEKQKRAHKLLWKLVEHNIQRWWD